MQLDTLPFPVDTTLTPESPDYRWEVDVIRDETGQIVEKEMVERKLREEGYKLGQPWGNNPVSVPYGLYKPLTRSARSQKNV